MNQLYNKIILSVNMKKAIFLLMIFEVATFLFMGCGRPPDSDVTSSSEYNFSSFAGTVWKTKVKLALVDTKNYKNEWAIGIFPPEVFDPTDPKYTPIAGMRIVSVLPVGTGLRIERLMQNNGNWGGVWVEAVLHDGTNFQKNIYVSPKLLAKNRFVWIGWSSSTNWGVNPDMLEAVTNAP